MTFLNPLVLFGLVAAGIPILIHLLQLKKLRSVEFSSVRFLKEIQHASARRVKLRDYLLLFLRTLAIAALVVAFSRPAVRGFLGANAKSASVVIADDSPSTTARNEYGEISSQIRSVASSILNSLHAGNSASLLFTSNSGDTSGGGSTLDPGSLANRLTRSEPSTVSGSYSAAIRQALRMLSSSDYANKEVYLVGDMQRSELRNPAAMDVPPDVRVFFLKTEESPNDNLSVSPAKLSNPVVEVSSPSQVEATVTNNGSVDKSGVVVALYLDGRKVAQSVVDIARETSRAVRLAFSVASSGFHQGVVQIYDNSIQGDNRYWFSFYAIQRLRVLIISASQGSDYVLSATQAVMDTSTVIETRVVTPAQFVYSNLSGVDVVVAESYPTGTTGAGQGFDAKVERFVDRGGGAIFFAPKPEEINSFVNLLAGMKIGSVTRVLSGSRRAFMSIEHIDASDDFFSGIFSSKESADQIRNQLVTKIYRGAVIQPSPFAHVLMSTSAGPFLMSREVGSGFAFVVASSVDTSSSNFPLSPFFPVVVQRALFYSATVRYRPVQVYAGQTAEYRYSGGGMKSAALFTPSGSRVDVLPEYVAGTARFTLKDLDRLGTYALVASDTLCEISVNLDPQESNIAQASNSEIRSFAGKLGFAEKNVFIVSADKNSVSAINRLRLGKDLSSFFAGAALLFLVAEIFVSRMKTI